MNQFRTNLVKLDFWNEKMTTFVMTFFSNNRTNFGPELIGQVSSELTRKFNLQEWQKTILTRYLSVSFYEGYRIVLQVKNDKVLPLDDPNAKPVEISTIFTYQERQLILVYMQFHLTMITEEQYWAEVTRLGFSKEQVQTIFKTKMVHFQRYEEEMKAKIISTMKTNLMTITGFTQEMWTVVETTLTENGDFGSIMDTIKTKLVSEFNFSETVFESEFRYQFNFSIFSGLRELFEIKEEDIKVKPVKPEPEPVEEEPEPKEKETEETNGGKPETTVDVTAEFTLVERQVIFYYLEFSMQMITQQEYINSITQLGYTIETVQELTTTKAEHLQVFESSFRTSVTTSITSSLTKIKGLTSEMTTEITTLLGGEWNNELLVEIEHMMIEKFSLSERSEIMIQLHYFFQQSVSHGVRETLHLSEDEVVTQHEERTTHESSSSSESSSSEESSSETITGDGKTTTTETSKSEESSREESSSSTTKVTISSISTTDREIL